MVLEAHSQGFRTGCPWQLLFADLVIIAELYIFYNNLQRFEGKHEEDQSQR